MKLFIFTLIGIIYISLLSSSVFAANTTPTVTPINFDSSNYDPCDYYGINGLIYNGVCYQDPASSLSVEGGVPFQLPVCSYTPNAGDGVVSGTECCPKSGAITDGQCLSNIGKLSNVESKVTTFADVFNLFKDMLYTFIGLFAFGSIVYGGFTYLTAGDSDEQVKKGQHILTYTIVGIALIAFSVIIIKIIIGLLGLTSLNSILF